MVLNKLGRVIPLHTRPAIMSLLPWPLLLLLCVCMCVCVDTICCPSDSTLIGVKMHSSQRSVINGTDTSYTHCIRKSRKLHKSNSSENNDEPHRAWACYIFYIFNTLSHSPTETGFIFTPGLCFCVVDNCLSDLMMLL